MKTASKGGQHTLGEYLTSQRKRKGMSLREVEEATDHEISNAYLSQLEHDKISKPSPNILYNLSSVYNVPYEILMEKAGYIIDMKDRKTSGKHGRLATFADESLTEDEEEALLDYLVFLRTHKRKR
jgi:transcriptional regulator with XRE-family HTH domain